MLNDLERHLFMALDRLNSIQDEEPSDYIDKEVKKARAISDLSKQVIDNRRVELQAKELAYEYNIPESKALGYEKD